MLHDTIHALVSEDEGVYIVECLEIAVFTQGNDLNHAVANLREAVSLHLEGENMERLGLTRNPKLQIVYEIALACTGGA